MAGRNGQSATPHLRVTMIPIRPVLMAHMVIYPVSVRQRDEDAEREQRD